VERAQFTAGAVCSYAALAPKPPRLISSYFSQLPRRYTQQRAPNDAIMKVFYMNGNPSTNQLPLRLRCLSPSSEYLRRIKEQPTKDQSAGMRSDRHQFLLTLCKNVLQECFKSKARGGPGDCEMLSRQSAHRWQQACQPYASAALYSPEKLFFSSGTHFC
jgi:hypothetical protein